MAKQRLVVVGNGIAGTRAVQEILARGGQAQFDIVIFGEEPQGSYDRTELSRLLSGDSQLSELLLNRPAWYAEHGITLHAGARVTHVDRMSRWVHATAAGVRRPYDKLILATGSRPFLPPIEGLVGERGALRPGAHAFRTLDDCNAVKAAAHGARRVAVLGGGLLGLEVARALLALGVEVHIVHLAQWLMNAQLDETAGRMVEDAMRGLGAHLHLGQSCERLLGDEKVEGVVFKDGSSLECDLLVLTAGVRPNSDLGLRAGLHVERAIVVDNHMRATNDANIYVLGECAQHRGSVYSLRSPIWDQAEVLADHITRHNPHAMYTGSKLGTQLNVPEIQLACMGIPSPTEAQDEVVHYAEPGRGRYHKLVIRQDRLVGAILLGDLQRMPQLFEAYRSNRVLPESRISLLFDVREPTEPQAPSN